MQCTHTVHVVLETKFLHRSHLSPKHALSGLLTSPPKFITTGQPKTPILLLLGEKITTCALKLCVWFVNLGTTPKGHHTTPCPQHLIKRVGLIVNGRHTHTHTHTHTAHVWVYCTVCVQCTHTVHVVLETNFYTGHTLVQNTIGLDPLPHTYRDKKFKCLCTFIHTVWRYA